MGSKKNIPLHDIVLRIMFLENMEKAAAMTPQDVLWHIEDAELTERHIQEVLDWLLRKKKVTFYLGKYSIDRLEFLEQKKKHKSLGGKVKNATNAAVPVTEYKNKKSKFSQVLVVLAIFILLVFSYKLLKLIPNNVVLIYSNEIVEDSIPEDKKLNKESYAKDAEKSILNPFFSQNDINKLDSTKLRGSISVNVLNLELQNKTDEYNSFLNYFIYLILGFNVLFVFLLSLLYFKE